MSYESPPSSEPKFKSELMLKGMRQCWLKHSDNVEKGRGPWPTPPELPCPANCGASCLWHLQLTVVATAATISNQFKENRRDGGTVGHQHSEIMSMRQTRAHAKAQLIACSTLRRCLLCKLGVKALTERAQGGGRRADAGS